MRAVTKIKVKKVVFTVNRTSPEFSFEKRIRCPVLSVKCGSGILYSYKAVGVCSLVGVRVVDSMGNGV